MPGKLRRLSGKEVVTLFEGFGFEVLSQRGDHAKLRRMVAGSKQTLVVPLHRELDRGTLQAIFRQALNYIAEAELRPLFYTK
jgi:predicted RNA binding protein YcfA (HicA-like mRNA interferase family)